MVGCIFDIKELALFDGPGLRTTVFFKGCPLACTWCHNPEGIGFKPELMVSLSSCTWCGRCRAVCPLPESGNVPRPAGIQSARVLGKNALPGIPADCNCCGACLDVCPRGIRRIVGENCDAEELAVSLLRNAEYLRNNGGGFTLSGGEPAAQGEFLLEFLALLRGNHRALETSGYCTGDFFTELLKELELVIMDIKIVEPCLHRQFTGQDNTPVLANLERLKTSEKPFIIRIPLIPGVSDTEENFRAAAKLLAPEHSEMPKNLITVELLPYHKTAGAKYGMLGRKYRCGFDTGQIPRDGTEFFLERGIPCSVL